MRIKDNGRSKVFIFLVNLSNHLALVLLAFTREDQLALKSPHDLIVDGYGTIVSTVLKFNSYKPLLNDFRKPALMEMRLVGENGA